MNLVYISSNEIFQFFSQHITLELEYDKCSLNVTEYSVPTTVYFCPL